MIATRRFHSLITVLIIAAILNACTEPINRQETLEDHTVIPPKVPSVEFLPTGTQVNPTRVINPETKTPTNAVGATALFIMESIEPRELIVFNQTTGTFQPIKANDSTPVKFLGWLNENCEFLIQDTNKNIFSPDADTTTTLDLSRKLKQGERVAEISNSSASGIIAFIVGVGHQELMHFEQQNLAIIRTDGEEHVEYLSIRGGVIAVSWSSNGDQLAFVDYDAQGNHQVFVWGATDGDINQITHFDKKSIIIEQIIWGSNDQKVYFAYSEDSSGQKHIGSTNVNGNNTSNFLTIEGLDSVYSMWSMDNQIIGLFTRRGQINEIALLNTVDDSYTPLFDESASPEGYIYLPGKLGNGNKIGFFSTTAFYEYDISNRAYKILFDRFRDVLYWTVVPKMYSDCFK